MADEDIIDCLALALELHTDERRDFLICSLPRELGALPPPDYDPDYYVQLAHLGEHPPALYAEAVSDSYLPPERAIGAEGDRALSQLGWTAPITDPSTAAFGSPNWSREFVLEDASAYATIARTILETFRAAFGYGDGPLRVELGPGDDTAGLWVVFDSTGTSAEGWSQVEALARPQRHLTAEELSLSAPPSYRWFRSLADVPGVDWETPPEVDPDSRLMSARPIADPDGYSRIGVAWIFDDGTLIKVISRDTSPADVVLLRTYEGVRGIGFARRAAADIVTMALMALAVPGSLHAYHSALRRLAVSEGVDPSLRERALIADVQLVTTDPLEALNDPRYAEFREPSLREAGSSFIDLMRLYVREGFLADALRVEAALDLLPDEQRPDFVYGRASQLIDELRLLRQ